MLSGSGRTIPILLDAQVGSLGPSCPLSSVLPYLQVHPESDLSSHLPHLPWSKCPATPAKVTAMAAHVAVLLSLCPLCSKPGTAAGVTLLHLSHIGALFCSHFLSETQRPQTCEDGPTGPSCSLAPASGPPDLVGALLTVSQSLCPGGPLPRTSTRLLPSPFGSQEAPGAFCVPDLRCCPPCLPSPSPTLCVFLHCTCY